ncbi:MAG: photosynthetic complex assembly protein PuhC [Pseudomonadota bacterium]
MHDHDHSHHHAHGGHHHGPGGHTHENMAPTVPLLLAGGLVLITLLGVVWQQTVINPAAQVSVAPEVVAEQVLQFVDQPDGSVNVVAMPSGEALDVVAPGEGNFLRGTLRGLVRERRLNDASMTAGFVVRRYADGAVVISDLATGRTIDLRGFGPVNAGELTRYLPAPGEPAPQFAQAEE